MDDIDIRRRGSASWRAFQSSAIPHIIRSRWSDWNVYLRPGKQVEALLAGHPLDTLLRPP